MAIFNPSAIGKPLETVLYWDDPNNKIAAEQYSKNKGLDFNHDGKITKAEAAKAVIAMLKKGNSPENRG